MIPRAEDSTRAVLREWWWLLAFLCGLTTLTLQQNWLDRLNSSFYDAAITLHQRELDADILVVAIDERSLDEIGRWPWRRSVYARLIDQLTAADVRAVGLDIILSEPDTEHPNDDALLGAAIQRNGHVVLPILAEPLNGRVTETPPIAILNNQVAALGHIQSNLDADGVSRRVFLHCGMGFPSHPQLALALLKTSGFNTQRYELPASLKLNHTETSGWYCASSYLIPFAARPGKVRQISASALLKGEIPAQQLRGKLVLVGATAAGLGDAYPTPLSGDSYSMPGVEMHAQLIDSLRHDLSIIPSDTITRWLVAILLVVALMVAYLYLLPRYALALTVGLMVGVLLVSAGLIRWPGIWLPPAESLLILALCYPLWSWRKLEAGMQFLEEEVTALNQESEKFSTLIPALASTHTPSQIVDPVAARIEQVRHASREVRVLRQLVNQSLISQSVGILVLDDQMRVRLVNPTLLRLLGLNEHVVEQGRLVDQVLSSLKCTRTADWTSCIHTIAQGQVLQCEAQNVTGGEFLVSITDIENFGWIINLDSVSTLKAHERERGRLLNFLSHDMRAPQASILALLEQQAARKGVDDTLLQDIRRFSQRTLHLINQFMFLARAEHLQADTFIELDMVQCMHDAIDEVWPQASTQGITLKRPENNESLLVIGNHALLQRALINLITNAVQHSAQGDIVQCDVDQQWGEVCCTVRDTGEGIAEQDQLVLFQSFSRVPDPAHPAGTGTGLGLALVKMVADKHRGRIEVLSQVGHGSTFFLYLTLAPNAIRKPLRSDYSSPLIS